MRLRFLQVLPLVAAALATASTAGADESREPSSYGNPIIVADSLAMVGVLIPAVLQLNARDQGESSYGMAITTTVVLAGGYLTYLLFGPIEHLAHGQVRRAGGSFALRLVGPGVGAVVGAAAGTLLAVATSHTVGARCDDDPSGSMNCSRWDASTVPIVVGAAIGGFGTALGVSLFDAFLLAKDDAPPADAKPDSKSTTPRGPVTPSFVPVRGGARVGLSWRF